MRGIVIDPDKREIREEDKAWNLQDLQAAVGGDIECPAFERFIPLFRGHRGFINEEGRLRGLTPWVLVGWPETFLVGPMVILGARGEKETSCSIAREEVAKLVAWE